MSTAPKTTVRRRSWMLGTAVVALVAIGLVSAPHLASGTKAPPETRPQAPLQVKTTTPKPVKSSDGLLLPAQTQALTEYTVYARVSGYIGKRLVDIGDVVKAGQTLAIIEAPDQDQQLMQARASQHQAEANLALAKSNYSRSKSLLGDGWVTRETYDTRESALNAAQADLEAAIANVKRLEQLTAYKTVTTAIDGIITQRLVEQGDLVVADASSGKALYQVSRQDHLRLVIDVPQGQVPAVTVGAAVDASFVEFPGRSFPAKVVRISHAVDSTSGTMRVEADLPNPDLTLPAGMRGNAHFPQAGAQVLALPVNTIVTRPEGKRVAIVDGEGKVRFHPVTLGREFNTTVEVVGGVSDKDRVVLNPNTMLNDGDAVTVAEDAPKDGTAK
ncbi:efflux RND transporter periplasmic adaptor subunit [Nitrospirillum sp. BR 11164]|uniref:efflux RND transporter periplasmic adaptor subunit n=1 Tax=Nitrospirillum sp. BR 11164 TaxID=3104324 RepID=UPI002AFE1D22|nr:efflux RND transporter periplasmic adaptor subunit [Nitrospirillum sp. BR 11164]MEA1647503.1 efflux RND transporter periplasmic adaptor subunit [Nitrospirillum sp. BR 11164]